MTRNITVPVALQHTQEATCCSPWYVCNTEYPPAIASYQALVNGEETFRAVHQAIAQAVRTIDIICWGFQPSMYFIRDGSAPCIGELLLQKAREGVEVRILGWEMPFNTAGVAGEANLPGKGPIVRIADRALQPSTEEQYAYDRRWFANCAKPDGLAAAFRAAHGIPVLATRGFSVYERAEIAWQVKHQSLDPQLSTATQLTLMATATHHQKTVLIDYEVPDKAVGFVMGHNMLDEYWDCDRHSARNRDKDNKPAPDRGPRGDTPRQDISSQVSGPIVESLHHNFATAWRKETGEDLIASRQAMTVGPQLCTLGMPQMAQILRTQPQAYKRDIERLYLQAVNNATQFIYIENQYFRWPPLAELIKSVAAKQAADGRDPGVYGPLHLFVITNATDDGVGAGTVNTQRMLESLGRGDTIPAITRLRRIDTLRIKAAAQEPDLGSLLEEQALISLTRAIDAASGGDLSDKAIEARRQRQENLESMRSDLEHQIKRIENGPVDVETIPNLKVHICSLVAPDSPGWAWMPVYIHSKLMIVNDIFTTHGSANINTRSMQVDSELNIAHEWMSVTQALRRRLWNLHTAGLGAQDDAEEAFDAWQDIIDENKKRQEAQVTPYASLVEFYYDKPTLKDLD